MAYLGAHPLMVQRARQVSYCRGTESRYPLAMNLPAKQEPALASIASALGKAALIMLAHPVWSALSQFNVIVSPSIPWAAVLMLLLLFLLWRFLDGRIGPKRSALARHALLKWHPLPSAVWAWALLAGAFAMASMFMIETNSCLVGGSVTTNAASASDFAHLPLWTGLMFLGVTCVLAAFVEESAFRGYMQSELAPRFGILPSIAIVAVAFAAFHLYGRTLQVWLGGLADWVAISCIFSALTYLTGSILPAFICHFVIDLALFSLDWFQDPLYRLRAAVPGAHMSIGTLVCSLSAIASLVAFRQLARVTSTDVLATS
jgi:membrane protease YdiL (CAAX protease family)